MAESNKENYGQLLDELMRKLVEPNLIHPVFVIDHPREISPLAKSHRSGEKKLVERFELFIGGAEFANSFSELNDPLDQRVRLKNQVKLQMKGYGNFPYGLNILEISKGNMLIFKI